MKQNWMKSNGKSLYFLLVFAFLAPDQTFSDEQLIKEYFDCIQNRQTAAWLDRAGNALTLERDNPTGNTVKMVTIVDEGRDYNGEEPASVLFMKAVPEPGKAHYGMEGRYTISLPAKKFYQFQGFVEAVEGKDEGIVLSININQKNEKGDWEQNREISGQHLGLNEYGRDVTAFVFDLSDWAGKEIQLCLSMKIDAAYSNVGGKESWKPALISSHWDRVRIVESAFRVVLGEPEKASELNFKGKIYRNQPSESRIQSVTAYPTSAEEIIMDGTNVGSGGDWHLTNPAESGVNTTYIPANGGVPGHFVAYITSRLYPTTILSATNAYPRVIDFRNQTTKNMGNATRTEIVNASYVDPTNNAAQMVIWPDSTTSDDWPIHYVAFPSVYSSNYSYFGNTVNVLHAFAHTEDSDQNDDGVDNIAGVYERIGYARSRTGYEDFGRQFTKTNHSAGNAIITYVSPEESINMLDVMYGCGGASVIGTTDYYYMIYHVRPIKDKNPDGTDKTRAAGIAIARATKSAIDNWAYSYNANPWAKYRQIVSATTSEQNWGQPGNGGIETVLWNSLPISGLRSQYSDKNNLWRAYLKVSYNTYLDTYYNDQVVILGKGGLGTGFNVLGVVIHTSSNLLEWSDYIIVMMDQPLPPVDVYQHFYTYEYPTLIGDETIGGIYYGGYSGLTCQTNKLYYQRDMKYPYKNPKNEWTSSVKDYDLYRISLRFQVY